MVSTAAVAGHYRCRSAAHPVHHILPVKDASIEAVADRFGVVRIHHSLHRNRLVTAADIQRRSLGVRYTDHDCHDRHGRDVVLQSLHQRHHNSAADHTAAVDHRVLDLDDQIRRSLGSAGGLRCW